ncbi:MAG TPA: alpha/beta fold hydrolase [Bacteroidota bacterium]|nr:alpha/beta fold hydrolase [Bacteroidota bacterium]
MSILLTLVLFFLLFLIGSAFAVLVIGPLILLQPQRRTEAWYRRFTTIVEPRDADLPQENITVTTHDGLHLKGWLVSKGPVARGTILFLHGVGDCKIAGIPIARLLFTRGYNVFLYDSREHGESDGDYCTYGYYEKYDVVTVIDYLVKRTDLEIGKIGVFGTSMGAAVGIQAAVLDNRIAAVIAEASFTDLKTISVDYQRRIIKLPWHFLRNVYLSRSQKLASFKARHVSPLEDVKRLRAPILFIHGTNDTFIRYTYSEILFERANEPKEILLIPGGDHTNLWEIGGHVYQQRITSFFDKHLQDGER